MPSFSDRVDGFTASEAIKAPVKAVAETNVTLSGEQTIGSTAVVEDDRVLCIGQTDPVDNGIYLVKAAAWVRAKDFEGNRGLTQGTIVTVADNAYLSYRVTTADPITMGVSDINFSPVSSALGASALTIVHVDDAPYNAVGDGATDDSAAIQSAIDAVELTGGVVHFGAKAYAIETGLVIDEYNVTLQGQGAVGKFGGTAAQLRAASATRILWTGTAGTGTMVSFTADSGDTGTRQARSHGGIRDIFIDGVEDALEGLEIQSWRNMLVQNVCVGFVRDFGYKIWTLPGGVVSGADDSQHNTFINCTYLEPGTVQTPVGMILGTGGGAGAGNASFNTFFNLQISASGGGSALELENTDNNSFHGARLSGGKVILHADDTGQLYDTGGSSTARYNSFFHMENVVEIRSKVTVAGSANANNNFMYGLSQSNGGASIAIEDGAEFWYIDSDGFARTQQLSIVTENSGPSVTPALFLGKNSDVGEASDGLGKIQWRMTNAAGTNDVDAGRINCTIITPTAANETCRMSFTPMLNGAETQVQMYLQNGMVLQDGVTAVASQGVGTVNVSVGFFVDDVQMIGTQKTGWGAPTGTPTRTTFATSTVTTEQLAERVKALIDDLTSHGLIGS